MNENKAFIQWVIYLRDYLSGEDEEDIVYNRLVEFVDSILFLDSVSLHMKRDPFIDDFLSSCIINSISENNFNSDRCKQVIYTLCNPFPHLLTYQYPKYFKAVYTFMCDSHRFSISFGDQLINQIKSEIVHNGLGNEIRILFNNRAKISEDCVDFVKSIIFSVFEILNGKRFIGMVLDFLDFLLTLHGEKHIENIQSFVNAEKILAVCSESMEEFSIETANFINHVCCVLGYLADKLSFSDEFITKVLDLPDFLCYSSIFYYYFKNHNNIVIINTLIEQVSLSSRMIIQQKANLIFFIFNQDDQIYHIISNILSLPLLDGWHYHYIHKVINKINENKRNEIFGNLYSHVSKNCIFSEQIAQILSTYPDFLIKTEQHSPVTAFYTILIISRLKIPINQDLCLNLLLSLDILDFPECYINEILLFLIEHIDHKHSMFETNLFRIILNIFRISIKAMNMMMFELIEPLLEKKILHDSQSMELFNVLITDRHFVSKKDCVQSFRTLYKGYPSLILQIRERLLNQIASGHNYFVKILLIFYNNDMSDMFFSSLSRLSPKHFLMVTQEVLSFYSFEPYSNCRPLSEQNLIRIGLTGDFFYQFVIEKGISYSSMKTSISNIIDFHIDSIEISPIYEYYHSDITIGLRILNNNESRIVDYPSSYSIGFIMSILSNYNINDIINDIHSLQILLDLPPIQKEKIFLINSDWDIIINVSTKFSLEYRLCLIHKMVSQNEIPNHWLFNKVDCLFIFFFSSINDIISSLFMVIIDLLIMITVSYVPKSNIIPNDFLLNLPKRISDISNDNSGSLIVSRLLKLFSCFLYDRYIDPKEIIQIKPMVQSCIQSKCFYTQREICSFISCWNLFNHIEITGFVKPAFENNSIDFVTSVLQDYTDLANVEMIWNATSKEFSNYLQNTILGKQEYSKDFVLCVLLFFDSIIKHIPYSIEFSEFCTSLLTEFSLNPQYQFNINSDILNLVARIYSYSRTSNEIIDHCIQDVLIGDIKYKSLSEYECDPMKKISSIPSILSSVIQITYFQSKVQDFMFSNPSITEKDYSHEYFIKLNCIPSKMIDFGNDLNDIMRNSAFGQLFKGLIYNQYGKIETVHHFESSDLCHQIFIKVPALLMMKQDPRNQIQNELISIHTIYGGIFEIELIGVIYKDGDFSLKQNNQWILKSFLVHKTIDYGNSDYLLFISNEVFPNNGKLPKVPIFQTSTYLNAFRRSHSYYLDFLKQVKQENENGYYIYDSIVRSYERIHEQHDFKLLVGKCIPFLLNQSPLICYILNDFRIDYLLESNNPDIRTSYSQLLASSLASATTENVFLFGQHLFAQFTENQRSLFSYLDISDQFFFVVQKFLEITHQMNDFATLLCFFNEKVLPLCHSMDESCLSTLDFSHIFDSFRLFKYYYPDTEFPSFLLIENFVILTKSSYHISSYFAFLCLLFRNNRPKQKIFLNVFKSNDELQPKVTSAMFLFSISLHDSFDQKRLSVIYDYLKTHGDVYTSKFLDSICVFIEPLIDVLFDSFLENLDKWINLWLFNKYPVIRGAFIKVLRTFLQEIPEEPKKGDLNECTKKKLFSFYSVFYDKLLELVSHERKTVEEFDVFKSLNSEVNCFSDYDYLRFLLWMIKAGSFQSLFFSNPIYITKICKKSYKSSSSSNLFRVSWFSFLFQIWSIEDSDIIFSGISYNDIASSLRNMVFQGKFIDSSSRILTNLLRRTPISEFKIFIKFGLLENLAEHCFQNSSSVAFELRNILIKFIDNQNIKTVCSIIWDKSIFKSNIQNNSYQYLKLTWKILKKFPNSIKVFWENDLQHELWFVLKYRSFPKKRSSVTQEPSLPSTNTFFCLAKLFSAAIDAYVLFYFDKTDFFGFGMINSLKNWIFGLDLRIDYLLEAAVSLNNSSIVLFGGFLSLIKSLSTLDLCFSQQTILMIRSNNSFLYLLPQDMRPAGSKFLYQFLVYCSNQQILSRGDILDIIKKEFRSLIMNNIFNSAVIKYVCICIADLMAHSVENIQEIEELLNLLILRNDDLFCLGNGIQYLTTTISGKCNHHLINNWTKHVTDLINKELEKTILSHNDLQFEICVMKVYTGFLFLKIFEQQCPSVVNNTPIKKNMFTQLKSIVSKKGSLRAKDSINCMYDTFA